MTDSITQPSRSAKVSGIGCFWVFAANHKDLPLGSLNPLSVCVDFLAVDLPEGADPDAAGRAEVDRIAAILGTEAREPDGQPGHWAASRDFGGGVVYTATAISREAFETYKRNWAAASKAAVPAQAASAA